MSWSRTCAPQPGATTPTTTLCKTSSSSYPATATSFALLAGSNVRFDRTGTKHLKHQIVGELSLAYETLYTAEPGSASQDALDILASWSATRDLADIIGKDNGWCI